MSTAGQAEGRAPSRLPAGALSIAVAVALLLALALAGAVAWNRDLQVDEVEHTYAAYSVHQGLKLYVDVWQAHPPLLYWMLAPLIEGSEPLATYRRERLLTFSIYLLGVALAGYCAARLAGGWAGVLAAGLGLLHTTWVERGMEIRPDGALGVAAVAALALELAPDLSSRGRLAGQGAILGLAALLTQKAAFLCLLFGLLWVVRAWRERRPRNLLLPLAAWGAVVGTGLAVLAAEGLLAAFLRVNVGDSLRVATGGASYRQTFGALDLLVHESRRNVAFVVLFAGGLVLAALRLARRWRPDLGFAVVLTVGLVATLFLNPFPFSYLHVTVLPVVAVLAAYPVGVFATELPDKWRSWGGIAVLGALIAAAATSLPRLLVKAQPALARQVETPVELARITALDDRVFDLVGFYFRPAAHPVYFMTSNLMARYRAGGLPPIEATLREREVVAFLLNYRMLWLRPEEGRFFLERFAHYDGNIFLLGRELAQLAPGVETDFEALKRKEFVFTGPGRLWVDGQPFSRGTLERGVHRLRIDETARAGKLILATPDPQPQVRRPPGELFVNFD